MKPLPTDSIKLTTHKVTRHTRSQSPTQTESPTATSSSASSSSSIPIIPTLIIDKEKYTDLEEQFTTSTWTKPQLPNPTAHQNLTHAYFVYHTRLWSTEPPPEPYIISTSNTYHPKTSWRSQTSVSLKSKTTATAYYSAHTTIYHLTHSHKSVYIIRKPRATKTK